MLEGINDCGIVLPVSAMARKWNDHKHASALKSAQMSSNKSILVSDPTRKWIR